MTDIQPWTIRLLPNQQIKKLAESFTRSKIDAIIKNVNEQSLTWLQENATKNLYEAVAAHGRDQSGNRTFTRNSQPTEGLRKVIADRNSHRVSASEVEFMVNDLVYEKAPYYRILNDGYEGFVGKEAPIGFSRGGKSVRPAQSGYPNDAALRGKGKVIIERGITGYHYFEKTRNQFLNDGILVGYLDRAFEPIRVLNPGIKIAFKTKPRA
jgi:hypothetical protein